eukprot:g2927.t1
MDEDREKKLKVCGCCTLFVILPIFLGILLGSYNVVDYDMYGLKYNVFTKVIEPKDAFETGRYMTGPGFGFYQLPRTIHNVIFNGTDLRKPIGFKDRIGGSFAMTVALGYKLRKDEIFNIFRTYRDNYEESYLSNIRSVLRLTAQKYSMLDFVQDSKREAIQKDFFEAVQGILRAGYSTSSNTAVSGNTTILSGFQDTCPPTQECVYRGGAELVYLTFGDAELDLNKESLILATVENKIKPQITNETKILQQISKETDIQVERLKQLLNTKVADAEQDIKNTVVEITKKRAQYEAETDKATRQVAAASTAEINVYDTETNNQLAKNELLISIITAETLKATNAIDVQKAQAYADLQRYKTQHISKAESEAKGLVEEARSEFRTAKAGAVRDFYGNLSTALGFDSNHLNTLHWIDMIKAKSESGQSIFTDLQQPSELQLDGQRDLYFSQLST